MRFPKFALAMLLLLGVAGAGHAEGADLNGDDTVDSKDLGILMGAWGNSGGAADLDASGSVGAGDLAALLAQWGPVAHVVVTVSVEDTAGVDQSELPVTFGQVFKAGDVPAGDSLRARLPSGEPVELQVDAKATHADGSLRHAVLTAWLPSLSAGQTLPLTLERVPAADAAAPAGLPDLLATSFDTTVQLIQGGTVYAASARDLLQGGVDQTWLQGPLVSEWQVSAPLTAADQSQHPHLTARFYVRAYRGLQQVRVDVVVENNWTYEPGPKNQTYDVSVSVGGSTVLSQSDLLHYHHARWRQTYWWGTEPKAHVRQNLAHLVDSGAVPSVDQSLAVPESALASLASGWATGQGNSGNLYSAIMGAGLINEHMPDTGADPGIGPLPRWTMQYLLSQDPRAAAATLGTAARAGSWSIHYRDRNTDRPVSLADFPYMTIRGNFGDTYNPDTEQYEAFPACGGDCGSPYTPDDAHQPSIAYVPYLVSGDYYLLEELQFWCAWNLFISNPYYRGIEQGLLRSSQVRGQAWSLRTLASTAYITPDSHPLKGYFSSRLQNNLDWYNAEYSNNTSANALGVLTSQAYAYNSGRGIAPWQDDFFTYAVGYTLGLGYGDAATLLNWKAVFPVGRMTDPGYCWVLGAPYSMDIRDSSSDPVYGSFAEVYAANAPGSVQGLGCGSQAMGDALGLDAGEMTGYSSSATGYPSNMQPALAVSVDGGATGADLAWQTFINRSVKPVYSDYPNFAIVPRP